MTKKVALLILAALLLVTVGLVLWSCRTRPRDSGAPSEKVTIACATLPHAALVHLAVANGFFAKEGVAVTIQPHPFGKAALAAVTAGMADIATAAETPLMFAVMQGEPLAVIATIQSSARDTAIVARGDRGILRLDDLRGKKVGVTRGTSGEFFLDSMLAVTGIEKGQVRIVELSPDNVVDALAGGLVDAVSIWNPYVLFLEEKPGGEFIIFYGETVYTETFNVIGRQEFLRKNPGAVVKLLKALIAAEAFAREHSMESQRIVAKSIRLDENLMGKLWGVNDFTVHLSQSLLVMLENESRWAIRNGLVKERPLPNYVNHLYLQGLEAVKPEAITIIR